MKILTMLFMLMCSANLLAVSYQGELSQSGNLYTGQADLQFRLFDSIANGSQQGVTDIKNNVAVVNGRFVVELDQWNGEFDGSDFWLEITAAVPAGSGNFVTLSPRQKISPVPYAEYAYDLDITGLQLRVTGTCPSNSAIQVVDVNGGVTCGTFAQEAHSHEFAEITNVPADLADGDDDTTYDGSDFAVSNQSCAVGQVVSAIAANGSLSCVNLPAASSPPPDCNQANQALQYDSLNGWNCVDITSSGPSAGEAQGFEITDSWGDTWDGIERQAKSWADADQTCNSLGGRLPTITELYRVSGAFKGDVGSPYEANYLWSQTWWDKTNKGRVRLTDGAINNSFATSLSPFRCIWPQASVNYFAGDKCMGEPGDACWNHAAYPGNMSMDKMERPPVSYVAATDECAFVNAHLADQQDYAENAINGLPNGTNNWQWTSNHARYDWAALVRWQDADTSYDDYSNTYVSVAGRASGPYRFRCVGINDAIGAHPTTVANEFIASNTLIKTSDAPTTAATFGDSVNGCFSQGGHMAHSRDIMELVRAGMTSGTGTDYMWLADWSRYDLIQIGRWTGVDTSYTGFYSEYVSWDTLDLVNEHQHRCAFYPIDASYTHPPDANCAAGLPCQQFENGASKLAVDTIDRSATTYTAATANCINLGGQLPTALQLTEAIRAGLDLGSGSNLWTSDSANSDVNGNSFAIVLKWNGTDNDFSPVYSSSATWSSKGATTQSYRCVWSNELK